MVYFTKEIIMGYMDLTVSGSDTAADAAADMIYAMIKSLKKSLKDPGNSYNTSGAVNVAMIFDEMIIPSAYYSESYVEDLTELANDTRNKLQKELDLCNKESAEWDPANKLWHTTKYKKLLKRLDTFLEKCDE